MARKDANPGMREAATLRRTQALHYRIAGNSYRKIAEKLGVSVRQAYDDVMRELTLAADANRDQARELQALEVERMEAASAAIAAQVSSGHLGAVDRWVRISERRAKLLGLDAPTRQEHSGPDGGPIETRQHPLDLTKLTDADLEQIAALNAKLQGDAPSP